VARPFPTTLTAFQATFPDDAACRQYLIESRWPHGFVCPACAGRASWERARLRFVCRRCRRETSVTAGTLLDHTRLSLVTWFWATYLVATTPGLNAMALGRQLGLSSRETTHSVMSRLRQSMSSLALPALSGIVEADEAVVGGYTRGARGFNVVGTNKHIVLVAVERGGPRTRLVVIPDRRGATLVPLLRRLVAGGSTVVTDGHNGYSGLRRAGYDWVRIPHPAVGLKGGHGRATPAADGAISRFKRWLLGTYHKPPTDFRPYLDEFCFRSEFRADPASAFATMLGLAVRGHELDRMPIVTDAAAVTYAPRPSPPSREQRVDSRRRMLAFSARRQRPGAGSMLDQLMRAERPTMDWWRKAAELISAEKINVAVAGGVAANAYMPPRHTADLDLAVRRADLDKAGQALKAAGWQSLGDLSLYEDLRGTAWQLGSDELDLIGIPGAWGIAAIAAAQSNKRVSGLPTLTLAYVVVMKLISARPQDSADISRMLGSADEKVLNEVRRVVKRTRPTDVEDLEQIIVAGQLEAGPQSNA
jgi:transposase-like protein